ncbi:beta-xylosidase [Paenibacillus montaniterrae]|uniref:Beta-xylosidase n=2 Tax=Paenibacillus montaniterrae TaxID=429341 RepID=A0A919YQ45_9BACL|nr:beta-xylosidase [Paenibacillus montaniterrae]
MSSKINNPIIWADVPDPSVIAAGEYFYMVSTSMHMMPGCPIMRSKDLVNWEIVNYVFDTLEDNDQHNMIDGGHIYSKGSWAACLREHNGIYYVCFSSLDTRQFYVYHTNDIDQGNWQRSVIKQLFHDPSLLFEEDRVFVIYGNGDIRITELTSDLTAVKEGGVNQLLLEAQREGIGLRAEGCHAYRINGFYYYFFIEWPKDGNQRRRQICYRSKQLLGPFESQIVLDDNMGYRNHGVAQGGIFEAGNGQWYSVLFQDHDAVGRIPIALPVSWKDGWPVFGLEGKAPEEFTTPLPYTPTAPIICSDEFDYTVNKLALQWQWNHNPDHALWTLTERPGYLRLKTGALADSVLKARNTLTQRTQGPACKHETLLELTNLQSGDHAGLVALQHWFGTVGARIDEHGACSIVMTINDGEGREQVVESVPYTAEHVYLKIEYNFENSIDQACFYFASEQGQWQTIGQTLHMKYTLDHFMGYRTGLFCYTSQQSGGYADFAYFHHSSLLK